MKNKVTEMKSEKDSRVRKIGYRLFFSLVVCLVVILCAGMTVFADGDPIGVVNNLSTFIFGLIRAVGIIILAWGVVQVGMSFQSHDPSQRSQGFLTLAGGLVITFAHEILTLIGVS